MGKQRKGIFYLAGLKTAIVFFLEERFVFLETIEN